MAERPGNSDLLSVLLPPPVGVTVEDLLEEKLKSLKIDDPKDANRNQKKVNDNRNIFQNRLPKGFIQDRFRRYRGVANIDRDKTNNFARPNSGRNVFQANQLTHKSSIQERLNNYRKETAFDNESDTFKQSHSLNQNLRRNTAGSGASEITKHVNAYPAVNQNLKRNDTRSNTSEDTRHKNDVPFKPIKHNVAQERLNKYRKATPSHNLQEFDKDNMSVKSVSGSEKVDNSQLKLKANQEAQYGSSTKSLISENHVVNKSQNSAEMKKIDKADDTAEGNKHDFKVQRGRKRNRNRNKRANSNFDSEENTRLNHDNTNKFGAISKGKNQSYDQKYFGKGNTGKPSTGFKLLEEVIDKDPAEIIMMLSSEKAGLDGMLKQNLSCNQIMKIVSVLSKVCSSAFETNKATILATACKEHFIDEILKHLNLLPAEKDPKVVANIQNFVADLITLFKTTMRLLPLTACHSYEKAFLVTSIALKNLEQYQENMTFQTELNELKKLQEQLNQIVNEQYSKRESHKLEVKHYIPPPDNFRQLTLYPTSDDVLGKEVVFLRPNIIHGPYQNVEHYLDVQFRLLREDFLNPLREGISTYLRSGNDYRKMRQSNVRIYDNVRFIGPDTTVKDVAMRISFGKNTQFVGMNWDQNQRFMNGALLCFSADNFESVFFGTVLTRNVHDLAKRELIISLAVDCTMPKNIYAQNLVMAECEVYFEPYYHVMNALKNMTAENFPMEKYIVRIQEESTPPEYVVSATTDYKNILEEVWPSASRLHLDDSQYNAFKTGLTREFVVIQGPPGTGKTYLGLKIATTLLKNFDVWNDERSNTPILVVCFTNHALDQFLEGLLHVTKKIVRVGGRSKSETLEPFNLFEKRKTFLWRENGYYFLNEKRNSLKGLLREIQSYEKSIQMIKNRRHIISLRSLKSVIDQHLKNAEFDNDDMLLNWLNADRDDEIADGGNENGMFFEGNCDSNENVTNLLENGIQTDECLDGNKEKEFLPAENSSAAPADPIDADEEMRNHIQLDEFDFDIDLRNVYSSISFALSVDNLEQDLIRTRCELRRLHDEMCSKGPQDNSQLWLIHEEIFRLENDLLYYKSQLKRNLIIGEKFTSGKNSVNVWRLSSDERWALYFYWTDSLKIQLTRKLERLFERLRCESSQYKEARRIEDLKVMKEELVVGMTTTAAARLQTTLQSLRSKIVIIEEAAEVMESHIIASLTKYCQHLILIGDHQQLRPNTADYSLAKKYHFDISLFERMVKNNIHCEVLKVQHRMRPEIAKLIVPAIYPELENHSSVFEFENIKGLTKNVFFIKHNEQEQQCKDSTSKKNVHEAEFIMALCNHLLLQGYSPEQITILTTYTGQMFYLKNIKSRSIGDVRITVVDNFQGEENDIILLSLVRSNNEGTIGFLKIENRVCVALSRARKGLYIIGNMDILTEGSKVWPLIKQSLEEQCAIGTKLSLRCQNHPEQWNYVEKAEDFVKCAPEGGCLQQCGAALNCGHICPRICHTKDKEHQDFKCKEPCTRSPPDCEFNHPCPQECWKECAVCNVTVLRELPCGHEKELPCHVDYKAYKCKVDVDVTMPDCQHKVKKPCHETIEKFKCPSSCEDRLPCGHSCVLECHVLNDPDHLEYKCKKECTRLNANCSENHKCERLCFEECGLCLFKIQKKLPNCDHVHKVKCSVDPATILCERRCKTVLPCGHPCPLSCYEECGQCPVPVKKLLPECNHYVKAKCCEEPDPGRCFKPCVKTLKCGHPCTAVCCKPCTLQCMVPVNSSSHPACGHDINIPCYLNQKGLAADSEELLSYCTKPCGVTLQCSHICRGTCGECLQGRVHMPCQEKCGKILICGHSCSVPCAENCPPCMQKCVFKCLHSKCSNRCGQRCVLCKEHCAWKCKHIRCSKPCYQMCNREPCMEPCDELLKCGHPCIGYCGEPCPPLCRVCHKDDVTTIIFGHEDEEDARFIYLEDCKHVIEAKALEKWLQQSDQEICMKLCPRCKTPITKTLRFMNLIRSIWQDIFKVKDRVFGDMKSIHNNKEKLKMELDTIMGRYGSVGNLRIVSGSEEFRPFLKNLTESLQEVNNGRRNNSSKVDVETATVKTRLLQELINIIKKVDKAVNEKSLLILRGRMDLILRVVSRNPYRITAQEVKDINLELKRFQKIAQLCVIESNVTFQSAKNLENINSLYLAVKNIVYSLKPFVDSCEIEVRNLLESLNKELKTVPIITDAERKDIVMAIGFRQGHWYKCPNGHVYVIADCGRPWVTGKCNECGAVIGGTGHRLTAGNQLDQNFAG